MLREQEAVHCKLHLSSDYFGGKAKGHLATAQLKEMKKQETVVAN
jgi:hypothetical protein